MTTKTEFTRPLDLSYNADFQSIVVAVNQLIDAVEQLQQQVKEPAAPIAKKRGRKPTLVK